MIAKLQGRAAIVSKASDGIGAAIAKALSAEGAAVVVAYDADKAAAESVVDVVCAAGGMAIAVHGDPSVEADAARLVSKALTSFGRLDIIVNPCGFVPSSSILDFAEGPFRSAIVSSALSLLHLTKAALPAFENGGTIINILPNAIQEGAASSATAAASLGAVQAITSVLARELKPRKVRVNAILTQSVEHSRSQGTAFTDLVASTSFNDAADLAVFLASPRARSITGETIHVGEMTQ